MQDFSRSVWEGKYMRNA